MPAAVVVLEGCSPSLGKPAQKGLGQLCSRRLLPGSVGSADWQRLERGCGWKQVWKCHVDFFMFSLLSDIGKLSGCM